MKITLVIEESVVSKEMCLVMCLVYNLNYTSGVCGNYDNNNNNNLGYNLKLMRRNLEVCYTSHHAAWVIVEPIEAPKSP